MIRPEYDLRSFFMEFPYPEEFAGMLYRIKFTGKKCSSQLPIILIPFDTRTCDWFDSMIKFFARRGVAQSGRALGSGSRGRRFKSARPDCSINIFSFLILISYNKHLNPVIFN